MNWVAFRASSKTLVVGCIAALLAAIKAGMDPSISAAIHDPHVQVLMLTSLLGVVSGDFDKGDSSNLTVNLDTRNPSPSLAAYIRAIPTAPQDLVLPQPTASANHHQVAGAAVIVGVVQDTIPARAPDQPARPARPARPPASQFQGKRD